MTTSLRSQFERDRSLVMKLKLICRIVWALLFCAVLWVEGLSADATWQFVGIFVFWGLFEFFLWTISSGTELPEGMTPEDLEPHPHLDGFGNLEDDEACFADFDDIDDEGRVRLDYGDFAAKFGAEGKAIVAGAPLILSDGERAVEGKLAWNEDEELWVAEIDQDDLRSEETSD